MHTEDEQSFLARQQQLIMQGQSPTASRGESPMRAQVTSKSTPRTPVNKSFLWIGFFFFHLNIINNPF